MFPPHTAQRIVSPYWEALLQNLQFQGQTNNCGPCTTATVINALCKKEIKGLRLADEMSRPTWRGVIPVVRRMPNSATFPWGMVDVFKEHGLKAEWSMFTDVEKIIGMLPLGDILMPIIGEWKPSLTAHVMTLIAWDEKEGFGFANTQYEQKEIFWVSGDTFIHKWKAMGNLLVRVKIRR